MINHQMTSLEDFQKLLDTADKPVFVMFSGTFCSPCRQLKPVFTAAASDTTKAIFVIVDVEEGVDICQEYKITKIPVIKIFVNSIEVDTMSGSNESTLKKLISKYA